MINSMKKCSCLNYMFQSIKSIAIAQSKNSDQDKIQNKCGKNNVKNSINNIQNPKKLKTIKQELNSNHKEAIIEDSVVSDKNSKNMKQFVQENYDLGIQSERNFINQSQLNQIISESNENDIPTQKSQIILNDIGIDVQVNQNKYMFQSLGKQTIWDIYQKLEFLREQYFYQIFSIRKKTSNQKFIVHIMNTLEDLSVQWKMNKEQSIQKYCELFEQEKHHLKCLINLNRKNCRNCCKIIDYQLKPPTIELDLNNKFDQGILAIVRQRNHSRLNDFLDEQYKSLSKLDKKKLIYQIIVCLQDVHESKLTVGNLSLNSFQIDLFQNIKLTTLNISEIDNKYSIGMVQTLQNVYYSSPQELKQKMLTQKDQLNEDNEKIDNTFKSFAQNSSRSQIKNNIWSLGIIICKILTGKFIFQQNNIQNQLQLLFNTLNHNQNQTHTKSSLLCTKLLGLSIHEMQIIESLLKIQPSLRIQCKQILQSDYFRNILEDSCQYSFEQTIQP